MNDLNLQYSGSVSYLCRFREMVDDSASFPYSSQSDDDVVSQSVVSERARGRRNFSTDLHSDPLCRGASSEMGAAPLNSELARWGKSWNILTESSYLLGVGSHQMHKIMDGWLRTLETVHRVTASYKVKVKFGYGHGVTTSKPKKLLLANNNKLLCNKVIYLSNQL